MQENRKRYLVLTGGGLSAGTTIAYLLDNTTIHIDKIFVEEPRSSRSAKPKKTKTQKLLRLRMHLGLARVMPREYCFRLLQKVSGISQADLVPWAARRPWLLSLLFGVAIPEDLRGELRLLDTEQVARQYDIPVEKTADFNDDATIEALKQEEPDLILGLGTRILRPEILSIPKIGALNGHSSLLPEYKGGVSEFWQLVHGETETGVTIHWMVPDVDAGEICAQRRWSIPRNANHHQLRLLSLFHRVEPWRDVVARIEADDIPGRPQGLATTPTFRKPTLKMEYDFYCRGLPIEPRTVNARRKA